MYSDRNQLVYQHLEALIEKMVYGEISVTFTVHKKRITKAVYNGQKKVRYEAENLEALQDIIQRIKQSADRKETNSLTYSMEMKNGQIIEVTLNSTTIQQYD